MRNTLFVSILILWCPSVLAAAYNPDFLLLSKATLVNSDTNVPISGYRLILAEDTKGSKTEPEPGTLVIPGEETEKADKKCLTVCKKWGEDCIINPRTGARNCRRTCKDFGKECF